MLFLDGTSKKPSFPLIVAHCPACFYISARYAPRDFTALPVHTSVMPMNCDSTLCDRRSEKTINYTATTAFATRRQ